MKTFTFIIPGRSVGKQETQVFTGKRKDGSAFRCGVKPEKSRNFHALVRDTASRADLPMMKYAKLRVVVALPYRVVKARKTMPDVWKAPGVRPDTDNVKKIVKDALQGISYVNDKNCIDDGSHYRWILPWEKPHTEVIITEISSAEYASEAAKQYIRENKIEVEI